MHIQVHIPENALLKEFVECFFIIRHESKDPHQKFLILPSVDTYLSVSLNTATHIGDDDTIITEMVKEKTMDVSLQAGLKKACIYEYRGTVKEICVRFKPLGAWSFLEMNDGNEFIPEADFKSAFQKIFSENDDAILFKNTEEYLLSRYRKFYHPYLPAVIKELAATGIDVKINLDELSKKYGISRQTMTSQFNKYLNLSPSQFRQISRFRKFIAAKIADQADSNLTDIVYDIGFFDQSHLIKSFRKYSFLHPLEFFRKINFSDNGKVLLIWQ
ncbi:helix-turn-helix domain-containing protein [Ferruginibacter sp. HRS2-29]|uniref:helix-turn-helix domain-containing protein n=1 Tax=Ferruginibacter sp. HRS2-29 TaxID=2487334 RepID=UPI0020CBB079|nr:helix-turn-helix domain-containing protein [Ferruginibacter sp. HRS2-29]MCP9750413.1 AraC family transcriptional regulator [Ferruginibacter sp. HRS2-29]